VEDLKQVIRKRLDEGEDLEAIRRDLIVKGHTSEEVNQAVAIFDWRGERKELKESGKEAKYEEKLQAKADSLLVSKIIILTIGGIALLLSILFFGILIAVVVLVLLILTLAGVSKRGIH